MRTALDLAAKGRYQVSPNPMVGAVLVKRGRIVGIGFHQRFGGPHAEVVALRDAGRAARGSTLYVSMEPCCFCGKTPACTEAILRAGVSRVYAATRDPHPLVRGRGMRCLRGHGVEVRVGLLGTEARRLNEAYFTYHLKRRPFVILKLAASLDGMLATRDGESQWITGRAARRRAQELRCQADAVLVGVDTVLNDDPRLTCRLLPSKRPLAVVLDSRLRIPPRSRLLVGKVPVLILTASRDPGRRQALVKRGAEVERVPRAATGLLDWGAVLAELYRRKLLSVLVEGGARTCSSALEAGVVDKVQVAHAPLILGPGRSLSAGMSPKRLSTAIRLKHIRHEVLGDDVMTEGHVAGN